MASFNIPFVDGNRWETFTDDSWYSPGCPTCDYGSEYVNKIEINTTHYNIQITFCQMYRFGFSSTDAIKLFAVDIRSMTEAEFIEYIDTEVHKFSALDEYEVVLRNKG